MGELPWFDLSRNVDRKIALRFINNYLNELSEELQNGKYIVLNDNIRFKLATKSYARDIMEKQNIDSNVKKTILNVVINSAADASPGKGEGDMDSTVFVTNFISQILSKLSSLPNDLTNNTVIAILASAPLRVGLDQGPQGPPSPSTMLGLPKDIDSAIVVPFTKTGQKDRLEQVKALTDKGMTPTNAAIPSALVANSPVAIPSAMAANSPAAASCSNPVCPPGCIVARVGGRRTKSRKNKKSKKSRKAKKASRRR